MSIGSFGRRILALSPAIALVLALPLATAAKRPPSEPRYCRTAQLSIVAGDREGAAGHMGLDLVFTNISSTTCALRGYPEVALVTGPSGDLVNNPAEPVSGWTPTLVTLAPTTATVAALWMVNPAMFDEEACHPVEVPGLLVAPRSNARSVYVPAPLPVCSVPGVGVPEVYPFGALQ